MAKRVFAPGAALCVSSRSTGTALLLISLLSCAVPASALTQSWNGYRWSRTGPLAITVGDNVSTVWKPFLQLAATQWSAANNIDFVQAAGTTSAAACAPVYGSVQACSSNYGANGWLGWANVWLANGFIVQATVRLNDYYFTNGKYATDAWRQMTACQEVGHTLGLAHANTTRTDLNRGTCMDYTNDPTGALGTNGTLQNLTPSASDFAALDGIYATLNTTQLSYTKPRTMAGEGFSIEGDDIDHEPTAVPEPAAWSMLLIGFGVVGATMRRRQQPARSGTVRRWQKAF